MSAIPGSVDTDQQPPMTIPLRHFLLGLVFLLAGSLLALGLATDIVPGLGTLAHVHLLLVGWVCVTIMGAMTQFVPVWSGVTLHSKRLANTQLFLVAVGLVGFSLAFVQLAFLWLAVFGAVMLAGFWLFVYNIARTLTGVDSYDVTERHFILALGFFCLLTVLGLALAIDLSRPVTTGLPVTHGSLLGAHVTLAVFGAVLTTIYGALYQLGTMFTQTELHGVDIHLQSFEAIGHPAGVGLLAFGRLFGNVAVARLGGILVLLAAISVGLILGRKLVETDVEWTPMQSRYAVLAPALILWGVISVPAWLTQPTAREHLFGAPGSVHLLVLGVIGFVVLGTLYHIIPFIIWVHQYSDLLGLEAVPMIDDLYDDRLAAADFVLLVSGTALLVVADTLLESLVITGLGGALVTLGVVVFTANMLLVVHNHGPQSIATVVFGSLLRGDQSDQEQAATEKQ